MAVIIVAYAEAHSQKGALASNVCLSPYFRPGHGLRDHNPSACGCPGFNCLLTTIHPSRTWSALSHLSSLLASLLQVSVVKTSDRYTNAIARWNIWHDQIMSTTDTTQVQVSFELWWSKPLINSQEPCSQI